MKTTLKLFRGEARPAWETRLLQNGWPQPLAGLFAAFLTGEGALPQWPPYGDQPLALGAHRAMQAYHKRAADPARQGHRGRPHDHPLAHPPAPCDRHRHLAVGGDLRGAGDAVEDAMNKREFEAFAKRCMAASKAMRLWVLDRQHRPIPATMLAWSQMFADSDGRRVAETHIGAVWVSTVLLGMDHGFGMTEQPLLFETMVFGGPHAEEMERYATWDEAVAGHAAMVARVKGKAA